MNHIIIISLFLVWQGSAVLYRPKIKFPCPLPHALIGYLCTSATTPVGENQIPPPTVEQTAVAVEYHSWFRLPDDNTPQYYKLEYGNKSQLENFKERISFTVYFHGIGENGTEDWILKSKEIPLTSGQYDLYSIVSVDYKNFVRTTNVALPNIESISKDVAKFLNWTLHEIPNQHFTFTGFGIGAYIAGRTAELLQEYYKQQRVYKFYALDPDTLPVNSSSSYQQIQITKSQALVVWVIHTSTCSDDPKIQACDNTTSTTMGNIDFYPNGGALQPGCGSNSSCSKFRATELYCDGLQKYFDFKFNYFYAWPCQNFDNFEAGLCTRCDNPPCIDMLGKTSDGATGRYFFYTNAKPPFGRGMNQTKPEWGPVTIAG